MLREDDITKNAKILVVDDDPINIRNAVRILKEDYKVSYATSGEKALEIIVKDIPDLVLLDLHMPGLNGFEVLERLKNDDALKDIPVIFLTADSNQETEVKGLEAGALDFIAKPFMDEIVRKRVRNILELDILQKNLTKEVEKQTAKAEERRKQVEEMSFQTVQALAGAIDAKDRYTKGHSSRVSDYAVLIAQRLGWSNEQIDNLRYAGLLHDVGKIGVPDVVLNKPGKLSDIEFSVIKSHTTIGYNILQNISVVKDALEVARHHHERYDGKGYPDGLAGEDIPIMARIVCVADSYDAMNSKRIYRNALTKETIRAELVRCKGSQFDPEIMDVFLELFDEHLLDSIEDKQIESKLEDNSNIIKRVFDSAYNSGESNQIDALTGLMLRRSGEEKIRELILQDKGALVLIDLDNLKKLNDVFGHINGDSLLRSVGEILMGTDRVISACRVGGDEFLIFMDAKNKDEVGEVLAVIYDKFADVVNSNESFRYNSLSAGIVMTDPTVILEDAYSEADKALYYAKRNGKGMYHYYKRESVESLDTKDVDLQTLIKGFSEVGRYNGALDVEYREFAHMFEYVRNMQKRYSYDVHLVMITLDPGEKYSLSMERITEAVTAMENAISNTIRTVDVSTMYSSMQFLIILMGSKDADVSLVVERIFSAFYMTYDDRRISLKYSSAKIED